MHVVPTVSAGVSSTLSMPRIAPSPATKLATGTGYPGFSAVPAEVVLNASGPAWSERTNECECFQGSLS